MQCVILIDSRVCINIAGTEHLKRVFSRHRNPWNTKPVEGIDRFYASRTEVLERQKRTWVG
jgi:hypothetical protein